MSEPKLSVIIPAYNASRYLREAIDSVLGQTYHNVEPIVINDGSSDDTLAIIESYGSRVVGLSHDNCGVSATRNRGIRTATGEYVAFLDADDVWEPEKAALQIEALRANPDAGLVACAYVEITPAGEAVGELTARDRIACLDETGTPNTYAFGALDRLVMSNVIGPPSAVTMTRSCIESVRGFDESFRNWSEDWDFYLRAARTHRLLFLDRPLLKYRVVPGSGSAPANARRLLDNDLAVLKKAFDHPELENRRWLHRRARAERFKCAGIAYAQLGRSREVRRMVLAALLDYPLLATERATVNLALQGLLSPARLETLKQLSRSAAAHVVAYRTRLNRDEGAAGAPPP